MIKIAEKYYLDANKNTYILYEKKIAASGKENYKNIGYFANINAIYEALINKKIKDDIIVINNIKKIVNLINELKEFTSNNIKLIQENDK